MGTLQQDRKTVNKNHIVFPQLGIQCAFYIVFMRSSNNRFCSSVKELHLENNSCCSGVSAFGSSPSKKNCAKVIPKALQTASKTGSVGTLFLRHIKRLLLEGRKHDPTFYPVIYGADESEDWTSPEVWKKANPSLDKTIGMDKVVAACNSAKETPGEENAFRQLRLNQWVKQAVRWMPMEKWDKCKVAFDEDFLAGRVCYGGLDLSSTTDITAFVLVFPPTDEDDFYYVLPYFCVS